MTQILSVITLCKLNLTQAHYQNFLMIEGGEFKIVTELYNFE